jgi:hypothetical protein
VWIDSDAGADLIGEALVVGHLLMLGLLDDAVLLTRNAQPVIETIRGHIRT